VAVSVPAPSSNGSDARRRRLRFAPLALAVALTACSGRTPAGIAPDEAVVTAVIDGDTLAVRVGGHHERIRLLGIDTPESVAPDRPVQCFGPEASAAMSALAPAGTRLRLVLDVEARDRYGRLLAYVYRADDDLFLNAWLVEQGFAATMVFEPNTAHAGAFAALEGTARAELRGLWGHCDGPDQPLG
jgi:micrococcal nuclease